MSSPAKTLVATLRVLFNGRQSHSPLCMAMSRPSESWTSGRKSSKRLSPCSPWKNMLVKGATPMRLTPWRRNTRALTSIDRSGFRLNSAASVRTLLQDPAEWRHRKASGGGSVTPPAPGATPHPCPSAAAGPQTLTLHKCRLAEDLMRLAVRRGNATTPFGPRAALAPGHRMPSPESPPTHRGRRFRRRARFCTATHYLARPTKY